MRAAVAIWFLALVIGAMAIDRTKTLRQKTSRKTREPQWKGEGPVFEEAASQQRVKDCVGDGHSCTPGTDTCCNGDCCDTQGLGVSFHCGDDCGGPQPPY